MVNGGIAGVLFHLPFTVYRLHAVRIMPHLCDTVQPYAAPAVNSGGPETLIVYWPRRRSFIAKLAPL